MTTVLLLTAGALLVVPVSVVLVRNRANRMALQALHRSGSRLDRFKLATKSSINEALLRDDAIAAAVREHAVEQSIDEAASWRRAEAYIDEIVPFFNIFTYYKIGLMVSKALLGFFYKVSAEYAGRESSDVLPRDAIVIYLMNHRSNADYVLVGYVLSGQVAISYAVGEWARTFPLEYIFKSFGAYFIRRKYREKLYHVVLERYVQMITRNGVTQGIFLEGGLSRDGKLGKAKIGLLDYLLGVARDPTMRRRIYIVPVAINYDRVLEDRSLLRELNARGGGGRTPLYVQLGEVLRYVWWNMARLVVRKWQRYGRAAVVIGEPLPIEPWLNEQDRETGGLFGIARAERLARVQLLADQVLERIAAIVPVTPVTLACAALQSFDGDFISHKELLSRIAEMREVLNELNARVIHREGTVDDIFDRAWKMLRMRRMLARAGEGYAILPGNRPLIGYYADSIGHLLGPFAQGVRERDSRPGLS